MKNFIQDGKTIEYKVADTAIKSGEVRVIGDLAGVAVTDEASAMEWAGQPPRLIEGRADNLKVTRPEDLHYLQSIWPQGR